MDMTAFTLSQENNFVVVFNMDEKGNLQKLMKLEEKIGTLKPNKISSNKLIQFMWKKK